MGYLEKCRYLFKGLKNFSNVAFRNLEEQMMSHRYPYVRENMMSMKDLRFRPICEKTKIILLFCLSVWY